MMGIGFPELMVILVIIMIIFGAGKLPEIGSAFGRSIKNFKTSMKEAEEASEAEPAAEVEAESTSAGEESAADPSNQTSVETEAAVPETVASSPAKPKPANKAPAAKPSPAKAPPTQAKKVEKAAKSEEEKMIEDAIRELKSKRIGTIKTPHDGLVQQGDVFTESVKRNPWGRKSDRGVRRDVL